MTGRGNYNKIDYQVRQEKTLYPIKGDVNSIDICDLKALRSSLSDFIELFERTHLDELITQKRRLLEINFAIVEEITHGANEFDAIITVSHKHKIPLNVVFLAYNIKENYNYQYEKYAYSLVIKILHDLGFKNIKIKQLTGYSMSDIAENIAGWTQESFLIPKHFEVEKLAIEH